MGLPPAALQALRQEEGRQMERAGSHVQREWGAGAAHLYLVAGDLSARAQSRKDAGHNALQVQMGVLRCHGLPQRGHQGAKVSTHGLD